MTEAVVLTAPGTLEVVQRASRPLGAGEVRLRVDAAGICGSDVHGYAGLNDRRPVGVVMGHETIGTVIEMSDGSTLEVGTRVAVNPVVACGTCDQCRAGRDNLCVQRRLYGCCLELDGGLTTDMVVSAANCVPVDASADVLGLALIEPMAVGTHAVRLARVRSGSEVLVLGGGPIGIAVALASMNAGAAVLISEPMPGRRELAEKLGAATCAPEEFRATTTEYELAFECVGVAQTIQDAITKVPPSGTIICLGLAGTTMEVPAVPLVVHERRMLGSSAYTRDDFAETARSVAAQAGNLANLVEHTVGLAEMPHVFAEYHDGRQQAMKTLYLNDAASL